MVHDTSGHSVRSHSLYCPVWVLLLHLTLGKNWLSPLNIQGYKDTDNLGSFETCVLFLCLMPGMPSLHEKLLNTVSFLKPFSPSSSSLLFSLHFSQCPLYGIRYNNYPSILIFSPIFMSSTSSKVHISYSHCYLPSSRSYQYLACRKYSQIILQGVSKI